jgi:hypothetical protein
VSVRAGGRRDQGVIGGGRRRSLGGLGAAVVRHAVEGQGLAQRRVGPQPAWTRPVLSVSLAPFSFARRIPMVAAKCQCRTAVRPPSKPAAVAVCRGAAACHY